MTFMTQRSPVSAIEQRISGLASWLDEQAPYVQFDQRHLDANTPEQAYWHLGYLTALRDTLQHLRDASACTNDTSSPFPVNGLDE